MGMTINGAGAGDTGLRMQGTLTIKNVNHPYARMEGMRKTEKRATRKLNYNHREISGQLIRAKKPQAAGNVLTRAKAKLATLQRAAGSGQYDTKEVANAIAHARRMVRVAQLKVQNLKAEEQERAQNCRESQNEVQQHRNEVKRRAAQKERELKSKAAIEEIQNVQKEKSRRQEMIRKRRQHRAQEQGKINEADMKYIKAQMENQNSSSASAGDFDAGVFVELSASAVRLAEAEMQIQTEAELEAQIEAEIAAEMALEMRSAPEMSGIASQGMMSGGVAPVSAGAGAVADVSV